MLQHDDKFAHFDNVQDIMDMQPADCNRRNWAEYRATAMAGRRAWVRDVTKWFGVSANYSNAAAWHLVEQYVLNGWPEGLAKAQDFVASARQYSNPPPRVSVRRRKRRADQGDFLDMTRVYQGNLDRAWETTTRTRGVQQLGTTVTIAVDLFMVWTQHADDLFWNGATALALVDTLQASGRNVQLVGYVPYRDDRDGSTVKCWSVTLKDAQQPLNEELLFAVVGLAGFNRVFGFKAFDIIPRPSPRGYGGKASGVEPESPFWEGKVSGKDVIYVHDCFNEMAARKRLEAATEDL